MNIQYTLLSEGSSDQALLPILSFVLRERGAETVESQWADIGRLREPPQALPDQIRTAIDLYPCDLLFVHRDADRVGHDFRREEIIRGLDAADIDVASVCVVPVRMTETWLLIDETAIREAAGRPRGRVALNLPQLRRLEEEANPKAALHQALRDASELRGRRLRDFPVTQRVRRVAELIGDFGALRGLSAFRALEQEVRTTLDHFLGRDGPSRLDDPRPRGTGAHRAARPRLLQLPHAGPRYPQDLRPRRCRRAHPRNGSPPHGPLRPRPRSHPQIRPYRRRPRSFPRAKHLAEAVQYRSLDRNYWT